MSMKDGNILNSVPEYTMLFHPPLVIHNVLPYEITISLADSASQGKQPKISIPVGDSVEVYHFSMNQKIRMAVQMQVRCVYPGCQSCTTLMSLEMIMQCSYARLTA